MANPYPAEFTDAEGTVRLSGEIDFTDAQNQPGGGIPQGGPLTADLLTDNFAIIGAPGLGSAVGGSVSVTPASANTGGTATVAGGCDSNFAKFGAFVQCDGATNADDGKLSVRTAGGVGVAGQALVTDGAGFVVYGGVQIAAGVPMGAPTGLPFAVDTTAVSGGLYVWNGAAWVKVSTIP